MSIYWTGDLGEQQVFEGPDADVALVRIALERAGVGVIIQPTRTRSLAHSGVYIEDSNQLELAREVVARFVAGETQKGATLAGWWGCPKCGERLEAQFEACWKCGTAKPSAEG